VSGQVKLRDSREASVRKQQDFSGVVISLEPLDGAGLPAAGPQHARMLQKNKTFLPHVLPVRVGTTIDFPNADPIFHNAFSNYSGQIFDVGLYPPGTTRAVKFGRAGVVRVFCNIHPAMSAVIVVLNTPYFAKTDASGRFAVDVPPGRYEMRVFHERASQGTLTALSHTVQVSESGLQLPPIVVSEAGYLPAPHQDKFGKPYSTDGSDGSVYPGVRK
jgi:plastocyanin